MIISFEGMEEVRGIGLYLRYRYGVSLATSEKPWYKGNYGIAGYIVSLFKSIESG